jgi:hypothetical protein
MLVILNKVCIFVETFKNKVMKITSNKSKRTYTIKNDYAKYRTFTMSKQEFDSAYYWTENDWKQFLKTDEYYKKIK